MCPHLSIHLTDKFNVQSIKHTMIVPTREDEKKIHDMISSKALKISTHYKLIQQ